MIERPIVLVLVAVALALDGTPVGAFTDLSQGRSLVSVDKVNPKADKISFNWRNEPGLLTIPESPLCPAESAIRIVTDNEVLPELVLDCSKWAVSGTGFVYRDANRTTGMARTLRLRPKALTVTLKGPGYSEDPITGPVGFVETRVRIGSTEFCGRWDEPPGRIRKNTADTTRIGGPTAPCQELCGNGILETGEACDDGNAVEGDGCRADCSAEVCGDGILDAAEGCDDGGTVGGDCCSATCTFETAGSPCADDANVCTDDACDGAGACAHTANAAPCNDGDGCTIDDVCSGGACAGSLRAPWLNEIDYDDFFGALDDRDEFIEIAAPAGTDLSGYQIVHVEGGTGTNCLTPHEAPFPAVGEAHMIVTIPPGTVVGDDTGTGIGFYVACFTSTSTSVVNLPACDDVLAAPRLDSNLMNGDLLNRNNVTTCADGVVLLDPDDAYVDALSWEGIVPALGTFGPFFHVETPYSIPRDEGWLAGVAIEKTSSTLERAQSETEWIDPSETASCVGQGGSVPPPECATFTRTPGEENSQQVLQCGSPCAAFVDAPESLLR